MMPARDFSALFTDRAGSRYIGGWTAPQHQADGAADRISPGHIQQQQQTRSNLFDKCLADCVSAVSLSHLFESTSSYYYWHILHSFTFVGCFFMHWGTSHRVQSSPCWNNQRVLLPPSLLCYTRAITHTICQLITPFRYFSPPLFIFIFYTTGRRRAGWKFKTFLFVDDTIAAKASGTVIYTLGVYIPIDCCVYM